MSQPLSDMRLERFCQHYAANGNALRSALAAGYANSTARGNASEMLRRPEVKARIEHLQQEANDMIGLSSQMIRKELAEIAFGGIHEFAVINEAGAIEFDFTGACRGNLRWLKKAKVTERYVPRKDEEPERIVTTELEAWDKVQALRILMEATPADAPEVPADRRQLEEHILGQAVAEKDWSTVLRILAIENPARYSDSVAVRGALQELLDSDESRGELVEMLQRHGFIIPESDEALLDAVLERMDAKTAAAKLKERSK